MSNLTALEAHLDALDANLERWKDASHDSLIAALDGTATPAQDRIADDAPRVVAAILAAIADTERAIREATPVHL